MTPQPECQLSDPECWEARKRAGNLGAHAPECFGRFEVTKLDSEGTPHLVEYLTLPDLIGGVSTVVIERYDPDDEWSWDYWTCSCGNYPENYGFYPVRWVAGLLIEVEPVGEWNGLYECDKCKAVYQDPLYEPPPSKARPKAKVA